MLYSFLFNSCQNEFKFDKATNGDALLRLIPTLYSIYFDYTNIYAYILCNNISQATAVCISNHTHCIKMM